MIADAYTAMKLPFRGPAGRLERAATAGRLSSRHRLHDQSVLRPRRTFASVAAATAPAARSLLVNGRSYRLPPPSSHTVALLLDGSSMEYLHAASAQHLMPCFNALLAREITAAADRLPLSSSPASTRKFTPYFTTSTSDGARQAELGLVSGCMPAFTNPNNVSVVTGVSARHHGISGNYYYDTETGQEVMMTDPKLIRCQTVLDAANSEGADITIITVKDKLTRLLSKGLDAAAADEQHGSSTTRGKVRCLSIEKLDSASLPGGVDLSRVVRDIYDPLCSISALQLGIDLLASGHRSSSRGVVVLVSFSSSSVLFLHDGLCAASLASRPSDVSRLLRCAGRHTAAAAFPRHRVRFHSRSWDVG